MIIVETASEERKRLMLTAIAEARISHTSRDRLYALKLIAKDKQRRLDAWREIAELARAREGSMSVTITHDNASLILARAILRNAYRQLGALPQVDPTIRCLKQDLAAMANDLTTEIESDEPELWR